MNEEEQTHTWSRKDMLAEFLSEAGEAQALWFGFYSSFTSLRRLELPTNHEETIKREYHYYTLGFFTGRTAQTIAALCLGVYIT